MNKNRIKIVETSLKIARNKLWQNISLKEIKEQSKVKSFDKIFSNKNEIIKEINQYFDYQLSLSSMTIEKSNMKDMIFEIIMMRFDIIQLHRKSIISIFNSFKRKPKDLIIFLPNLLDSILKMMNHINFYSKGILGQIKIKGVLIIYISTFFTWLNDDTVSLEKTMTTLDKVLDQAGGLLKIVK